MVKYVQCLGDQEELEELYVNYSPAAENRGGIVVVLSRDSDRAAECVKWLRTDTCCEQHLSLSCDVGCYTSVQNSLQHIQNNLGHVNVLVNAAGVNYDNVLNCNLCREL